MAKQKAHLLVERNVVVGEFAEDSQSEFHCLTITRIQPSVTKMFTITNSPINLQVTKILCGYKNSEIELRISLPLQRLKIHAQFISKKHLNKFGYCLWSLFLSKSGRIK